MTRTPLDALPELPRLPGGETLIDSHCHLDMREFDGDRPAVLDRAAAAGIAAMVTIGAGGPLECYDRAVALAGIGRARVWRLYMAASAVNFEDGNIQIHHSLGVRSPNGQAAMPPLPDWDTTRLNSEPLDLAVV